MISILVLCTGNSCRSQMMEGYLRLFLGNEAEIFSAGIESHGLNPRAVEAMAMDEVDISHHTSDNVSRYMNRELDYVITVCDDARENCPYIPGDFVRIHHSFSDPAKATGTDEEILAEFIRVRNEIRSFAQDFTNDIRYNEMG